ncbi:tyrosine phenol-lyase, partial [candidate division WOR-3 bacterium]|nr:tyrosine phenol-lyase [candidate division WOR-3 bacterium]
MIVPPYKVKLVEPIKLIPYKERKKAIEEAGFNPFLLPSKTVFIDLVSDSGTSAMSIKQLGSMFSGDE